MVSACRPLRHVVFLSKALGEIGQQRKRPCLVAGMYLEERMSDRKALWEERCKPKISNLDVELDHPLSDVFARRRFAVERERAGF